MQVSQMAAIPLLRSQISLVNYSKFKLLRPSVNSLIIYSQHVQNPNFSHHFRPIHSITPKSFPESPDVNVNGASEEPTSEPTLSMSSSLQSSPTNSINGVASNGQEESRNRVNLSPITPKSFPESPLVNVNGASEEPTAEPTPRRWSIFSSPQSSPTNSINGVASNGQEELRNRVNLSPVTPKSFPESPLVNVNGASEEPTSEPCSIFTSPTSEPWLISSSPQSSPTNSINGVASNGKEESRNQVNLSPITPKSSSQSSPTNSINGVASNGQEESRNRVNLSPDLVKSVVSKKSVAGGKKEKTHWVCVDCGHSTLQWWGTCMSCEKVGTLKQMRVSENEASDNGMSRSWLPEQMVVQNAPVRLMDVNRGINHMEWRIRLAGLLGMEVNRVLGGGVVPGSLILVGGDPGVGKSTLALQMAALVAMSSDVGGAAPVLYISGEESVEQIGNRADRLSIVAEDLFLYSSTDIEDILEKVQVLSPHAVVIDSIQTMYLEGVTGSPGGMSQVKECTATLLRFAKKTNIPVLLIGHVNKNGDIAGPRVLEHIVDVVLYMEGDKNSAHRLLRSVKNRFGSSDELGVFAMSESGLKAVSNPSEMFLSEEYSDSEHLAGLAITVIIDGSRSFLVEVQALCVSGAGSTRHVNGVQLSRADLILSVLRKQAGLKLDDHSVFLNVISGVTLAETSGDLAVAMAICSSFLEFALPSHVAFIGEIGLAGELRMVPRIEKRVVTLAKLGYKKCVVPASAKDALAAISSEIQIVCCKNLKDVINTVFRRLD